MADKDDVETADETFVALHTTDMVKLLSLRSQVPRCQSVMVLSREHRLSAYQTQFGS